MHGFKKMAEGEFYKSQTECIKKNIPEQYKSFGIIVPVNIIPAIPAKLCVKFPFREIGRKVFPKYLFPVFPEYFIYFIAAEST